MEIEPFRLGGTIRDMMEKEIYQVMWRLPVWFQGSVAEPSRVDTRFTERHSHLSNTKGKDRTGDGILWPEGQD